MGLKHKHSAKANVRSGKANGDWERFEKLVCGIEKLLAVQGARVALRERIETITGDWVTPDATVRIPNGLSEILVILECRKRNQISDQRWVQELMGKQRATNADRVIAVSNKRVTEPTIRLAKTFNIEIRLLSKVRAEQIPPLLQSFWMEMVNIDWEQEMRFQFAEKPRYPRDLFERMQQHITDGGDVLVRLAENLPWRPSTELIEEAKREQPYPHVAPGQDPPAYSHKFKSQGADQMEMQFNEVNYAILGVEIVFHPRVTRTPHQITSRSGYGLAKVPPGFFATMHESPGGREGDTVVAVTDPDGSWLKFNLPQSFVEAAAEYQRTHGTA